MARRALIVGAGIGGLAAARALRAVGFEVRVLERASSIEPLGAAISLWPNAVRSLQQLGVRTVSDLGRTPGPDAGIRARDGRMLAATDATAIEARFGAPLVVLHRASLQSALLADGIAELVETGVEVVGTAEATEGEGVMTSAGDLLAADLVLGADGIRSAVRAAILADGPPRHSGLLSYRAIAPRPAAAIRWGEYWGPGGVFGVVPLDEERVYWFATRRAHGNESRGADPTAALLQRFQAWAPEISEVIRGTEPEAILQHDLYDRRPSAPWSKGAVALLGDAAHPMLPFLGQGGCQALEDAVVLGKVLAEAETIPTALRAYEAARRRRVGRIVRLSRRFGRISHLRSPIARGARDRALRLVPERNRLRALDPILGR